VTGPEVMRGVLVALGAGSALWLADRALLRLEAKAWIYYRRRKASPGTLGSAFLAVQSLLEPGARHAVEERLDRRTESDDEGDTPPPGSSQNTREVGRSD